MSRAEPVVRRGRAGRQADRGAAAAVPQPGAGERVPEGAGDAGPVPRQPEEGGQPALRRGGEAEGRGRLRGREPDLEDELPAGARQGREKKPYLQGWAVVENPTDEDWNGVHDGPGQRAGRSPSRWTCTTRCTSPRPTVEPELFASLRPVAYSGGHADGRADSVGGKEAGSQAGEAGADGRGRPTPAKRCRMPADAGGDGAAAKAGRTCRTDRSATRPKVGRASWQADLDLGQSVAVGRHGAVRWATSSST